MKRIISDWSEAAYLMCQGFTADFEPSSTHPTSINGVFEESEALDICSRDYRSNKGVPVLSFQAAMKKIAFLCRKHREGTHV